MMDWLFNSWLFEPSSQGHIDWSYAWKIPLLLFVVSLVFYKAKRRWWISVPLTCAITAAYSWNRSSGDKSFLDLNTFWVKISSIELTQFEVIMSGLVLLTSWYLSTKIFKKRANLKGFAMAVLATVSFVIFKDSTYTSSVAVAIIALAAIFFAVTILRSLYRKITTSSGATTGSKSILWIVGLILLLAFVVWNWSIDLLAAPYVLIAALLLVIAAFVLISLVSKIANRSSPTTATVTPSGKFAENWQRIFVLIMALEIFVILALDIFHWKDIVLWPSLIAQVAIALLVVPWFKASLNREFRRQTNKLDANGETVTVLEKHSSSVVSCGLMSLGLLVLPFLPRLTFVGLLLAFPIVLLITQVLKKRGLDMTALVEFCSPEGLSQIWANVQSADWWHAQTHIMKSVKFWLVMAVVITLLFLGSLWSALWIAGMIASYMVGGFNTLPERRIRGFFFFGSMVNWNWMVIWSLNKHLHDGGYVLEGPSFTWFNPAFSPIFGLMTFPYEKKEQIYMTEPTQVKAPAGKPGSGGGVWDSLQIVGIPCHHLKQYWALGDDERTIIVKDQIIYEEEGDKGNLGVALREVKAYRRKSLQSMDMDTALATKSIFGDDDSADAAVVAATVAARKKTRENIAEESGLHLLSTDLMDINTEDDVREALEAVSKAQYEVVRADIMIEAEKKKGEARGAANTAEIEAMNAALLANPEAAEWLMRQKEAESISLRAAAKALRAGAA